MGTVHPTVPTQKSCVVFFHLPKAEDPRRAMSDVDKAELYEFVAPCSWMQN